jgi:hypothetical protein
MVGVKVGRNEAAVVEEDGCWVSGFRFQVSGFRFQVSGIGFQKQAVD